MFNFPKMLVVLVILFLLCPINCESKLFKNPEELNNLKTCVVDIIEKHFIEKKVVTYVDFHADSKNVLDALHESAKIAIISKGYSKRINFIHRGYVINARNTIEFLLHFDFLKKEPDWNPSARFIILVERMSYVEKIFDKLRISHVINAVIINATNQADVYSYNPFENFACGRYYERIVSHGPCALANISDFYPNKMATGLRNCTINIAVSHLPPFTMNPGSCDFQDKEACVGIEQFALNMMAEFENLKVNYSYVDFAQEFSDIYTNMTAVGSFSLIQRNQTDGLLGFTFLSDVRAKAFNYVYQHIAYNDRLVYVVKKAGLVPAWKSIYLAFHPIVWLLIFIVFVISTLLIFKLANSKDKGSLFLKMWDTLFLHGCSVQCKFGLRIFVMVWIWFAFLINAFYQSSLMSLTTHPSKDFQISTEEDLQNANLRPCITSAITDFLVSFAEMKFVGDHQDCVDLVLAMEKVSKSHDIYTIISHEIYKYNLPMFQFGEDKLYHLRESVMETIYALFLYKGFPWLSRLEYRALQLKENGLIQRHSRNIYYNSKIKHVSKLKFKFKSRAIVPWEMLLISCTFAFIVFIIEVLGKPQ